MLLSQGSAATGQEEIERVCVHLPQRDRRVRYYGPALINYCKADGWLRPRKKASVFLNQDSWFGQRWLQWKNDHFVWHILARAWPKPEHGEKVHVHHELDHFPRDAQPVEFDHIKHWQAGGLHQVTLGLLEKQTDAWRGKVANRRHFQELVQKSKNFKELLLYDDVQCRGPPGLAPAKARQIT